MKAFIKFNKGVMGMPIPWQLWLLLLLTFNLVIPFFFLGRLEAQLVLATMLVNTILMTILTGLTGFSRLLGLGHFPWFFLLYFLWVQLDHISPDEFFGIWLKILIFVNALSLVVDTIDVARYLAGDRQETVQGL